MTSVETLIAGWVLLFLLVLGLTLLAAREREPLKRRTKK